MGCPSMTSSLDCLARLLQPAVFILLIAAVAACSNKQLYEASHQNRLQECEKLVASQRQSCREEYSESYDEYRRRLEVEKQSQK